MEGIWLKDLSSIIITDPNDIELSFGIKVTQESHNVTHNIFHTFDTLEPTIVDALWSMYICKEWGAGLDMGKAVKREEVKRLVQELMGEGSHKMRNMAAVWKEKACIATSLNGSSGRLIAFAGIVVLLLAVSSFAWLALPLGLSRPCHGPAIDKAAKQKKKTRSLFNRIVEEVTSHSSLFRDNIDCTIREGSSPLLKYTSAIYQLAYDIVLDFLDEYLQISTKTSRLSLDHFYTSVMEIFGLEFEKPVKTDVVKLY
nr:UDP-glycosyltransferase 85C2-like [Tanacetum cinerariifolium]